MKGLKFIFCFLTILFLQASAFCQIGIGTTNPDPSAELDVFADNKGILIPRIILSSDLTNPSPITDPAEGLLVFNNGMNQQEGLYYWTGAEWLLMQTPTDDTLSGPGFSTDEAIVRFDGNTGKLVKNSIVTIDDNKQIANVNNFTTNNIIIPSEPFSGAILTSDINGDGSWMVPSSLDIKQDEAIVLSGASTLNFVGGSTVHDEGDNNAMIAFYKNSVTRDFIQLSSGDSLSLNVFGTYIAIPWDIELQKNNASYVHSNTTNSSRIYVRTPGIYEVNFIVNTISKTLQRKTLRIRPRRNGTDIITYGVCYSFSYNQADFESAHNSSSFLIEMEANDYIELIANGQTNDGPLLLIPEQNVFFMRLLREN